jgi:putative hydrolase of the HAD superfamily
MQINLEKYDTLIFDFGGVIINIDYNLSVKAFEKLGFNGFDNWYSQAEQHKLFDDLETGKIGAYGFYNEVRRISKLDLTNNQIEEAWNALLLNLPEQRISILEKLSQSHQLFLLSNTNEIHANSFSNQIENMYGWNNFKNLFEKVYLSHEINLRKPNLDIFEFVINTHQLNTNRTLFIDDSKQHIDGAIEAGIDAYFLDVKKGESILGLF